MNRYIKVLQTSPLAVLVPVQYYFSNKSGIFVIKILHPHVLHFKCLLTIISLFGKETLSKIYTILFLQIGQIFICYHLSLRRHEDLNPIRRFWRPSRLRCLLPAYLINCALGQTRTDTLSVSKTGSSTIWDTRAI